MVDRFVRFFLREPSSCVSSIIYCISTVNTQHMQRPDVLVQLGYIWRHVSAVNCTIPCWPEDGRLMVETCRQI